ncbi:MAG: hypothetical protein A2360_04885 [Candidatus Staskawiczbacteria bacterium RIFOXYB1_FULL_32_11]|uniref:Uncharacterized protein n=1 Tax=Candidatus Staskawiczbacteria bacterium RIFOXYD1_FULL_32_13 TaxID=1802234 RepID=A0A1G2JKK1_9BACT|nr:MAG: hypothetical protein UR22_C0001G0016 [Parcubacteria group bacterium GW2011_GWC2_32_10]OGZ79752.1 MAG: hypothetical protein A2360_04885 [Candidatus Staskawiczbacteria bacterium RIFOXYB1_FULL_32_11]OGZ81029.1 MAG: hypothetical protein A2256_04230 [Candidatus Staskawiczbacteria bacterium RIFOXYA2_FULL_32_7]OGZ87655.1 MAG: hypothetical protein A2561_03080 [Candidatus Staskawiczbacteria bacterium RIFOXYD1_FULL_32_13]
MKFNPDSQLNIHELAVEEPEKKESGLSVDMQKYIDHETWKNMNDKLESFRNNNNWNRFIQLGMNMKIIDPDIDFGIDDLAITSIKDYLEFQRIQSLNQDNWSGFNLLSLGTKIIDPAIDIHIGVPAQQYLRNELKSFRDVGNWGAFARTAIEMQIFDAKADIGIDDKATNGMTHKLEAYRKRGEWFSFISLASDIKILGINTDIKLDELEAKQGIKNQLEQSKNYGIKHGDWNDFGRFVRDIKILIAEKAEITDKGLEITMPKEKESLQSDVPAIPEQKQF